MSYSRPALSDLLQRIRDDMFSRLSTDDVLRRSDAEVLSRVMAGVTHGLYGFVDWVSRQILPDTADAEILDRQATIWGVPRKPASVATGTVTFTVQAGAVIPEGTLLQALDGVQYQTTADATMAVPNATAPIESVDPAAAGNRATGQSLSMVSPIAGVNPVAVAGELSGGADIETDDELRSRVITRIQQPPQGGCAYDYQAWALEVEGVTRAWVYPQELGIGTVTVRFARDDDASPIPDAGEVAAVQAHIDARRPVTAQVTVVAPVAAPLNFTITGLDPATTTVRAAVEAELADLILREAVPGGTLLLSHIRAAISAASGENDFSLTAPAANVSSASGAIITLGSITWL